jgi:hypothetical protein
MSNKKTRESLASEAAEQIDQWQARAEAAEARVAELEAGINELLDSGRFYRSAFEFDFSIDGEEIGAKLNALAGRKEG